MCGRLHPCLDKAQWDGIAITRVWAERDAVYRLSATVYRRQKSTLASHGLVVIPTNVRTWHVPCRLLCLFCAKGRLLSLEMVLAAGGA